MNKLFYHVHFADDMVIKNLTKSKALKTASDLIRDGNISVTIKTSNSKQ